MKYYVEETCDTCGCLRIQELTEKEYFERFKTNTYKAAISWDKDGLLTCISRNIAECENVCKHNKRMIPIRAAQMQANILSELSEPITKDKPNE